MLLQDEDSESEILHKIQVVRTLDEVDRQTVSHSCQFKCIDVWEACVDYWTFSLILFRLCLKLLDLDREMPNQSRGGEQACGMERPWLNLQKLQYDQERMAKNFLLSSQSFDTLHRGHQCKIKPLALIGAWGALMDVANRSSHQSEKSLSWRS